MFIIRKSKPKCKKRANSPKLKVCTFAVALAQSSPRTHFSYAGCHGNVVSPHTQLPSKFG